MAKKSSGITAIAELAGVSIGTVDRALHGRPGINPETRQKILAIAQRIGYKPNLAARYLSTARRIRIGVCVPREIAFFYNELWDGLREEVRRYSDRGVDFTLLPIPKLGQGERAAFRKLLDARVNGIVITPGDPSAMTPLIDRAESDGIRVVCVSTDAPQSHRSSIIAVEPRMNGAIAGELMARFVPPASKVAVVTGMLKTMDHREKTDGFVDSFRRMNHRGQVVTIVEAHEDIRESYSKTKKLLASHPDLAGIYVNTVNCLPVCKALSSAGRSSTTRLIATDLFREMVPEFEAGTIAASIYQRPFRQGQLAVRSLAEHLLHGTELPPSQYLQANVILRCNLRTFREAAPLQRQTSARHRA